MWNTIAVKREKIYFTKKWQKMKWTKIKWEAEKKITDTTTICRFLLGGRKPIRIASQFAEKRSDKNVLNIDVITRYQIVDVINQWNVYDNFMIRK